MRSRGETNTGKSKGGGSAGWVVLDNGGTAVVSLASLILMARILGPAEFATAALSLTIVQLLNPLVEGFFHDAIVQRRGLLAKHVSSAWIASIAIGAGLAAGLWILAAPLGRVLGLPAMASVLPWMGLSLLLSGMAGVPAAFARRRKRYRLLAIRSVTGRFAGTGLGLAMAALGCGATSVVGQNLGTVGIGALLLLWRGGLAPRAGFSAAHLRELLPFSVLSLGEMMLWTANGRLATLIIGTILGPLAAAHWNVATRLVEPVQGLVGSVASHLALPILSRRQHDPAAISRAFVEATRLATLVVMPVFAGIALCAPEIVGIFLGARWVEAAPLVSILSCAAAVSCSRQFAGISLTAVGRPGRNVIVAAQGLAAGTLGLAAGAQVGLAVAMMGAALRLGPVFLTGGAMFRGALGLGLGEQMRPAIPAAVATVVMAAVVYTARTAVAPAGLHPALLLGVSVILGAVAYLGAAAVVARPALLSLIRRVRPRRDRPATADQAAA